MRYKQTVVGVLWTVLRPALTVAAFVFVFNKVAKISTVADVPYTLMVFVGLLPWTFFATALTDSSGSVVNNAHIVGKVYFPRLIVPISAMFVSLVDALINFAVLAVAFAIYGFTPDWRICFLPLLIVLTFAAASGPGMLLAALNVRYRDIRFLVPFIVQFGLYLTPVGFPVSQVPERFKTLYWAVNPMAASSRDSDGACSAGMVTCSPSRWPGLLRRDRLDRRRCAVFRGFERSIADEI